MRLFRSGDQGFVQVGSSLELEAQTGTLEVGTPEGIPASQRRADTLGQLTDYTAQLWGFHLPNIYALIF